MDKRCMAREQVVTALIAEMRKAQGSSDFPLAGLLAEASEWVQNGGPASEMDALRAELEEARGALDAATDLLSLAEHAWGPEDYEKQKYVNDVYKRLAARERK